VKRTRNLDVADIPGGGAAAGLGAAMAAFRDAELRSGARDRRKGLGLEKLIEHADLVITAEGRIDEQNLTRKDTDRSDWADIDSIPTLRNA